MKTKYYVTAFCLMALMLSSCGSSKKATADNYYSNPTEKTAQPTLKKREVREVDKLVAAETDKMRAVGIGNDFDEKESRREAILDAQNTLAGYLETCIVSLTQEYHKKSSANAKKFSESNLERFVEAAVSQKVSTKMIGLPEVFDASDGTVQVYVCVELQKPTDNVLGEIYDQLTQDEILGIDYDKMKFIQDNKDRLQELREKVK
ncbi:MAG: hypothetical protein KBT20_11480 [Bacteroidales bacterium]|nr:hypothetical protein [Candidatus Liminaster caballi]